VSASIYHRKHNNCTMFLASIYETISKVNKAGCIALKIASQRYDMTIFVG